MIDIATDKHYCCNPHEPVENIREHKKTSFLDFLEQAQAEARDRMTERNRAREAINSEWVTIASSLPEDHWVNDNTVFRVVKKRFGQDKNEKNQTLTKKYFAPGTRYFALERDLKTKSNALRVAQQKVDDVRELINIERGQSAVTSTGPGKVVYY